jgi:hypothetical protein
VNDVERNQNRRKDFYMDKKKTTKWEFKISGGYYRGNPPVGISISLFEPIEDYPSGWFAFYLLIIKLYKFELDIGFDKVHKEE